MAGFTIDRRAVKAGAIRFAHGAPETHTVDYLGDEPAEYVRIELRTEPKDRPARDGAAAAGGFGCVVETQFETGRCGSCG